jgi:protein involved in polysaccharide export with SLBB domain
MLIFTLAAAMTVAMLIATAIGLHEEAQRVKLQNKVRNDRYPHRR